MAVVKQITPDLIAKEHSTREFATESAIGNLVGVPGPYDIGSGDVLSIIVWGHPDLTNVSLAGDAALNDGIEGRASASPSGFVVDHEGAIQFPYIGRLPLAGLNEEAARQLLTRHLQKYIKNPSITLRVQAYRSKRVYVDGEVKSPGLQSITDIPMTLMEALNRAGGLLPTADQSRIRLSRGGASYRINLPQMVERGVNPANILLAAGDVVKVVSRDDSKVFISGEVISPRALAMRDGRLTLNEALGESGGINPASGDASRVYVIRKVGTELVIYTLDAKLPGAFAVAQDFELNAKDTVYVAATPLTNWHRTISQVFPGALSSAVSAAGTRP
ncbi:polysaccharide biosynthesis/export family protein [Pseudoduganella namucuonensis]|nr:polysaccharide biosynthesis/export family protein [Pseudoduganella namucuonensis]